MAEPSTAQGSSSAPPTKRLRLDDGPGSDKQDPPEKYKELWFDDGSIVIQCPTASFRVHRSLLSVHSEVFRDMFTVGSPSNADNVDGIPVVHVSDSAEDMYQFLKRLYFANDVPKLVPSKDMRLAVALLALSTKYIAETLRQAIVASFCATFPSTLAAFQTTCLCDDDLGLADLVRAAEAGLKYNVPQILPAVYFLICRGWKPDDIFAPEGILDHNDNSFVRLPPEAVLPLARGPSYILRLRRRNFDRYMDDFLFNRRADNAHCDEALNRAFTSYYTWQTADDDDRGFELDFGFFNPKGSSTLLVDSDVLQDVCEDCVDEWKGAERDGRGEAWTLLPTCFKLPTWEELLAQGQGSGI